MDDASPELLGADFQDDLLAAGAIDFYFTPVQMKKGRSGLKLSVLATLAEQEQVSSFLLEHTPSIGVRYYPVERNILDRENLTVDTKYGEIKVKVVTTPSGSKRYKIEYESLRSLKELHNISILKLEEELYPILSKRFGHEKK